MTDESSQEVDQNTEEQDTTVSEDVQNPESDVREEYEREKANLRNIREAIKREKERLEKLESAQAPSEPVQETSDDDVQKRFLNTEARATIAYIAQTDPAFKEIAPLVYKKVEQGVPVEQAIRDVKASLFDRISSEASKAEEVNFNKPNQLTPTAEPEPQAPKLSGNILKDAAKGKFDNVPPELQNTLRRYVSDIG